MRAMFALRALRRSESCLWLPSLALTGEHFISLAFFSCASLFRVGQALSVMVRY